MSLIHEALKKAEEQRRLGEPPSLGSPISRPRERRPVLPFLLVAIVAAGGVGWWLTRPPAVAPAATATAPAAKAPASSSPAPASAAPASKPPGLERVAARSSAAEHTPVAEPRNPVLPPLGAPIPPGPQLLKTPRALAKERAERESAAMPPDAGKPRAVSEPGATASMKAAPVAKADKVPMPDTGPTTRPAASPPASAPSVVASGDGESKDEHPAPGPGAAPDPNAPPLFWQLPYGVRKDLPALNLTMHVYSPDPAKRFVVINGDRKSEGDTLGSDISLREIRADGVVLEVHGQRFLVPRGGG